MGHKLINEATLYRKEYFKFMTYSRMCRGLDGFDFTSAKEADTSFKDLYKSSSTSIITFHK